MKILMIFQTPPYPPALGGASKRNFPLFLENIKRHEVSVLSFGTRSDEHRFREAYGDKCRHIAFVNNTRPRVMNFFFRIWRLLRGQSSARWLHSRRLQIELDKLLRTERFDLIHCCTTILGYHDLPRDIPLVGDMHNVEHDVVRRTYDQRRNFLLKRYSFQEFKLLKRDELVSTDKFDAVITMTERDREIIGAELPGKRIHLIPHGVEEEFFEPTTIVPEPYTITFVGLMSYYPNHQGIMWFLDDVFPRIVAQEPKARLLIVGAKPSKILRLRGTNNVTVTGWVDDVRPYFARGKVFIVPLLIGGGMRGKALEAMAMGRPIVTTSIGVEGISLQHGESALLADTAEQFAECVLRLFDDAALYERLAVNARRIVRETYSWEKHGVALDRIYQSLVHPDPRTEQGYQMTDPLVGER